MNLQKGNPCKTLKCVTKCTYLKYILFHLCSAPKVPLSASYVIVFYHIISQMPYSPEMRTIKNKKIYSVYTFKEVMLSSQVITEALLECVDLQRKIRGFFSF